MFDTNSLLFGVFTGCLVTILSVVYGYHRYNANKFNTMEYIQMIN